MRRILLIFVGLICLMSTACQDQGAQPLRSDGTRADDNPQTAPLVELSFNGFNPETTTLRFSEGEAIRFRIEDFSTGVQTASLRQTAGPQVDFGTMSAAGIESGTDLNVGNGQDDVTFTLGDAEGDRQAVVNQTNRITVDFVAPSVTRATTLIFQFRSASATQSRVRNISVIIEDNASALTLTGQVSKGLVKNTDIRLFSVDQLTVIFSGNREIIDPTEIDETGTYTFTVLPSTDFEELLRFEVKGDGADMICDAPFGCNEVDFGQTFEVEDDLDLRALIKVPPLGTTRVANVNIMTTLATKRAGQLNGFKRISPGDLRDGNEDVASVFGIDDQDFSTVPFVDVTQPITSTDENAVRIAMISGGILGATFLHSDPDDDEDYLEELDDFIDEFGDREVYCQDAPDQTTASIEDVMAQALEIARINGDLLTRNYFLSRLNGIRNGSFKCEFETPPLEKTSE